jgi:hypothetical protein
LLVRRIYSANRLPEQGDCLVPVNELNPDNKTYSAPKLIRYGDLRRITAAKGGGANDGGAPKPNTKASGPNT